MHKIYKPLDPHIAPVVMLLREKGFNTFTSCDGGEGHAFLMPTVRIDSMESIDLRGGRPADIARTLLAAGYKGFYVKVVRGYGDSLQIGREAIDSFIEVEFWTDTPVKET